MNSIRILRTLLLFCVACVRWPHEERSFAAAPLPDIEARPARDDEEVKFWLENMLRFHRYTSEEAAAVLGISREQVVADVERFRVSTGALPTRDAGEPLRVLPYPGGRHPRIGFLDGAVRPQRETKISVFAPWDETAYVVVDVPEAIWCQDGLLYLAHTHVPTIWTKQGIELPKLEWTRHADGQLSIERALPNRVTFVVRVLPQKDGVRMRLQLTNGSDKTFSDLRVQMCGMLKFIPGLEAQMNDNKRFEGDYACCHSADGSRWVIMAWTPNHRTWGNAPCPCVHSDPKLPDCPPGSTVAAVGWLSFYEGSDLDGELRRLEGMAWRRWPETDGQ